MRFSCICLFVLYVLVFVIFLFLLVSGGWLQFVIVALPGLFYYFFDMIKISSFLSVHKIHSKENGVTNKCVDSQRLMKHIKVYSF